MLPGAGFGFLYFLACEVTTGSTLGKKALGLHVNGRAGASKPSIKDSACATRTCCSTSFPASAECCGSSPHSPPPSARAPPSRAGTTTSPTAPRSSRYDS
ncbi:RDD family protein [Nocardia sp. NPDC019309]|uniref:RDD family protein n=1 Tax=unclassified Nocardia TaxID=2637762 RepID=UPI0034003F56